MATRKETRSIADLVADVAYRKRRAAQVRFAGTSPGQESPRDVYLAACASIGAYLDESFGFKYSKSGPHARRRTSPFRLVFNPIETTLPASALVFGFTAMCGRQDSRSGVNRSRYCTPLTTLPAVSSATFN
jgi:hypothetical protein